MQRPDPIELMEVVEGLDRPLPVKDPTSVDPAEAWLKELMEVVVREHGATAMRTEDIEELGERLRDRSAASRGLARLAVCCRKTGESHGGQGTG